MEGTYAEIRLWAPNWSPRSWAFCRGQLLPIMGNEALFSCIGTIYGGDGRTTLGLPDFRGRVAIGAGQGPRLSDYRLGQEGGLENYILNVAQLPSHSHPTNEKTVNVASGNDMEVLSKRQGHNNTGNTGGNQAVYNMQPFLAVNYIICIEGVFPSRP